MTYEENILKSYDENFKVLEHSLHLIKGLQEEALKIAEDPEISEGPPTQEYLEKFAGRLTTFFQLYLCSESIPLEFLTELYYSLAEMCLNADKEGSEDDRTRKYVAPIKKLEADIAKLAENRQKLRAIVDAIKTTPLGPVLFKKYSVLGKFFCVSQFLEKSTQVSNIISAMEEMRKRSEEGDSSGEYQKGKGDPDDPSIR